LHARQFLHATPGRLEFRRTDLEFEFEAKVIGIALRVRNAGRSRSKRTVGRIDAAPFGAFLPWTPLTAFEVPPLEPGATTTVVLRVPRPALGGAGEPPRIEPPQIESPRARRKRMWAGTA
jgi:hypothetical protein